MATLSELEHLSSRLPENVDAYRSEFTNALPFRHIAIDNFFEEGFARRLLAEFPAFESRLAVAEGGNTGGKAVNPKIREISPAYAELYSFISGEPFLEFMSQLSGIPDLLLDPKMFGGGTHENRHGQELDPHIDFNYAEEHGLHRRLNLIVYLNEGWKTEWGGAIEIHSNPRRPDENRIRSFDPLFNRAIMFETNEISWHGFPRIELPEQERRRSRKSISIYLYTKDRPAGEIAPPHSTFYVQRPLPERLTPGHALTPDDVTQLRTLLIRRDHWIELYQKMELDKNRQIQSLDRYLGLLKNNSRLPLTGYVLQKGAATGAFDDGWIASDMTVQVNPLDPVSSVTLYAYRPAEAGGGRIRIFADGAELADVSVAGGAIEINAPVQRGQDEVFTLRILFEADCSWTPANDDRDLALNVSQIRFAHPAAETKKTGLFRW
jgi:hypothetical protein